MQLNHKIKHFTFTSNLIDILSQRASPAVMLACSRQSILVKRFRETFGVVLDCEDRKALFLGEVVAVFNRCI